MAEAGENEIDSLKVRINACRACVGVLPGEPKQLVQLGETARVLVIGQAPGSKAHACGRAWSDEGLPHRLLPYRDDRVRCGMVAWRV